MPDYKGWLVRHGKEGALVSFAIVAGLFWESQVPWSIAWQTSLRFASITAFVIVAAPIIAPLLRYGGPSGQERESWVERIKELGVLSVLALAAVVYAFSNSVSNRVDKLHEGIDEQLKKLGEVQQQSAQAQDDASLAQQAATKAKKQAEDSAASATNAAQEAIKVVGKIPEIMKDNGLDAIAVENVLAAIVKHKGAAQLAQAADSLAQSRVLAWAMCDLRKNDNVGEWNGYGVTRVQKNDVGSITIVFSGIFPDAVFVATARGQGRAAIDTGANHAGVSSTLNVGINRYAFDGNVDQIVDIVVIGSPPTNYKPSPMMTSQKMLKPKSGS